MAHARTRKSHTEGGEEEEGGKKNNTYTQEVDFFFLILRGNFVISYLDVCGGGGRARNRKEHNKFQEFRQCFSH